MHTVLVVAPTVEEYFPAPQEEHEVAPDSALYVPAPHATHVSLIDAPRVVENRPALQSMQVELSVAPVAVEYLPAEQNSQEDAPACAPYVPTPH